MPNAYECYLGAGQWLVLLGHTESGINAIPETPLGVVVRLTPFPLLFVWCVRSHTSCADQPDATSSR